MSKLNFIRRFVSHGLRMQKLKRPIWIWSTLLIQLDTYSNFYQTEISSCNSLRNPLATQTTIIIQSKLYINKFEFYHTTAVSRRWSRICKSVPQNGNTYVEDRNRRKRTCCTDLGKSLFASQHNYSGTSPVADSEKCTWLHYYRVHPSAVWPRARDRYFLCALLMFTCMILVHSKFSRLEPLPKHAGNIPKTDSIQPSYNTCIIFPVNVSLFHILHPFYLKTLKVHLISAFFFPFSYIIWPRFHFSITAIIKILNYYSSIVVRFIMHPSFGALFVCESAWRVRAARPILISFIFHRVQ